VEISSFTFALQGVALPWFELCVKIMFKEGYNINVFQKELREHLKNKLFFQNFTFFSSKLASGHIFITELFRHYKSEKDKGVFVLSK
jgi:hypothetical protein